MNSEFKISVIIPSYNRAKSLERAMQSVLRQSYKNLELIIVDDCSTDNTEDVVKSIKDERVHYIKHTVNKGACAARNTGVSQSVGAYIAFQDSDDIWYSDKLYRQLDYLRKNGSDFVFCGMTRKSNGSDFYIPSEPYYEEKDAFEQLLYGNSISTQTMLMKRYVAEKVHFDVSLKRFQDWDFALQVTLAGFKVGYLKEPLVEYLLQEDSISKSVSCQHACDAIYEKYKSYYEKNPQALAFFYMCQAREYRSIDKKKTQECLIKSMKKNFTLKTLMKLFLNAFGLWK